MLSVLLKRIKCLGTRRQWQEAILLQWCIVSSGVFARSKYILSYGLFPRFPTKMTPTLSQKCFHLFGHQSNSDWSHQQWIHSKVVAGNCSDCTKTCTCLDTVISSNGNIVITNCNQNKNCTTDFLAVIDDIKEPVTKVLLELPLDLSPPPPLSSINCGMLYAFSHT